MKWPAFLLLLSMCALASAGNLDAVPACHDKSLPEPMPTVRELLVAIDQTTPLSPALQQSVANSIRPFLVGGSRFSIVVFSAYTQGHYTEVLTAGQLDSPLPEGLRNEIAKPLLARLDACLQRQPVQAAQAVGQALRLAYQGTSSQIAKSDIFASLQAISAPLRQSAAREKIVLVVSDMLENSSIANFYADQGRAVRTIDAAWELRNVESNHLLADFGNARVYVIGAGLLEEKPNSRSYRDPKTMQSLASFWAQYFSKSNAKLIELGQPALLSPMR